MSTQTFRTKMHQLHGDFTNGGCRKILKEHETDPTTKRFETETQFKTMNL
jgi:hypothetical protein